MGYFIHSRNYFPLLALVKRVRIIRSSLVLWLIYSQILCTAQSAEDFSRDSSRPLKDAAELSKIARFFPCMQISRISETTKGSLKLILIEDIHSQEEAQTAIWKTLQQAERLGIRDIFLEGGTGAFQMGLYQTFPEKKIREKTAQQFLNNGFLTGAECASLVSGSSLPLFGIENFDLYLENLKAFLETRKLQGEISGELDFIRFYLKDLVHQRFSQKLQFLFEIQTQLEQSQDAAWTESVEKVISLAKEEGIEIPALFSDFSQFLEETKKIDAKGMEKEQTALIDFLEKHLSKKNLKKLVRKSLEYRLGRSPSFSYFAFLRRLYQRTGGSFEKRFPMITQWSRLEKKHKQFKPEILAEALADLTHHVSKTLACKEGVEKIWNLTDQWMLFENLIELKLSRAQLQQINHCRFDVLCFEPALMMHVSLAILFSRLDLLTQEALHFYECAQRRDKILVQNALAEISRRKLSQAVLIAGGFHMQGIEALLKEKGISFITLIPRVSQISEVTLYEHLMTDIRFNLGVSRSNLAAPASFGGILVKIARGEYRDRAEAVLRAMLEEYQREIQWQGEPYLLLDRWLEQINPSADSLSQVDLRRLMNVLGKIYPKGVLHQLGSRHLRKMRSLRSAIACSFSNVYFKDYPGLLKYLRLLWDEDAEFQTAALKSLGPPLSEKLVRELTEREKEWRETAQGQAAEEYLVNYKDLQGDHKNIRRRIKWIYDSHLPPEATAWPFVEDENGHGEENGRKVLVIVMRAPQRNQKLRDEIVFHECREGHWSVYLARRHRPAGKVSARRFYHILASAEESVYFSEEGGLTPYHQKQLNQMKRSELLDLILEYESGARSLHHDLIKTHLGAAFLRKVKAYEARLIAEAKRLLAEKGSSETLKYQFSAETAFRITALDRDIRKLKNDFSGAGEMMMEVPSLDADLPLLTIHIDGVSTVTRLLMSREMVRIFHFHGIKKMIVKKDCAVNLFLIVAALGALEARTPKVTLREGEGFKMNGALCSRLGTSLEVAEHPQRTPSRLWEVSFINRAISQEEILLGRVEEDIGHDRLVEAKKLLQDVEDVLRNALDVDPGVRGLYKQRLIEFRLAFQKMMGKVAGLTTDGKTAEAVVIIETLYEGFYTEPRFQAEISGLREHLPLSLYFRYRWDQERLLNKETTLRDILHERGFRSPRQLLESLSEDPVMVGKVKEWLIQILRDSFFARLGVKDRMIEDFGFATAVFYEMLEILEVRFEDIDLQAIERLESELQKLRKSKDILQKAVHKIGFGNLNVFAQRFNHEKSFHSLLKKWIERAFVLKGRYEPFVCDYLGISPGYLKEKIAEYGIDVSKIEHQETERLETALAQTAADEKYEFSRVMTDLGYPDAVAFRTAYRGDSEVENVLKKFFRLVLREKGANAALCARAMGLEEHFFRTWLNELGLKADDMQTVQDQGKKLRHAFEQLAEEEAEEKGDLSSIPVASIGRFNLSKAVQKMGWKNMRSFLKAHGDDQDVQTVMKEIFERALEVTQGNKESAGKLLGFSNRKTFKKWSKVLGVTVQQSGLGEALIAEMRSRLTHLGKSNRENIALAAAQMGFGKGNPETSMKGFMRIHGAKPAVREFLNEIVTRVLREEKGVKERAAVRLGISPASLKKYCQDLGVQKADLSSLPNFALDRDLNVSGVQMPVDLDIDSFLDKELKGVEPSKEPQAVNGHLSFGVRERNKLVSLNESAKKFLEVIRAYMRGSEYLGLSDETRKAFEETRLVLLDKRSPYLMSGEKGTVFAHFGFSGEAHVPTLYMRRYLFEYLAQYFPKALTTLIKLEMNRKIYRDKNSALKKDTRTSWEAAIQSGISFGELVHLFRALAWAQAEIMLRQKQVHLRRLAEAIVQMSQNIDQRPKRFLEINGFEIDLKGYLLEAMGELLARKISRNRDEKHKILDAIWAIRKVRPALPIHLRRMQKDFERAEQFAARAA